MPGFPVPANEERRLRELRRLRFNEWGTSAALDDLCAMAARLLDTPIAHLSLVERNEQLFAGKIGLHADRTARAIAFCAHTIMTPEPFIVEDVENDPRFCQNPLVTERPHIRAYLGIPLETAPGLRIGALCAVDHKARAFTDSDVETLTKIAGIAVSMLKNCRAVLDLDDQMTGAVALQEKMLPDKARIEQSRRHVLWTSQVTTRRATASAAIFGGLKQRTPSAFFCTSPTLRATALPRL